MLVPLVGAGPRPVYMDRTDPRRWTPANPRLRLWGVLACLLLVSLPEPAARAGSPAWELAGHAAPDAVYRLPAVHLWQHNPATYHNDVGCGAFTTAMALSVYDPARYGSYQVAHTFFGRMLEVPIFGGTFEEENASIARAEGFLAAEYDRGTVVNLAAAIDVGAPVILLVDPLPILGVGRHDVLLVGYRLTAGWVGELFVDDPGIESAAQPAPRGPADPGNETLLVANLTGKWTGVFTPIFRDRAQQARWRELAGR